MSKHTVHVTCLETLPPNRKTLRNLMAASFGFQLSEIVNPVVTRELDGSSQKGARPVSTQS